MKKQGQIVSLERDGITVRLQVYAKQCYPVDLYDLEESLKGGLDNIETNVTKFKTHVLSYKDFQLHHKAQHGHEFGMVKNFENFIDRIPPSNIIN